LLSNLKFGKLWVGLARKNSEYKENAWKVTPLFRGLYPE